MDSVETRQAVMEARLNAHERADDERYSRIDHNIEKIASAVESFGERLDKGFTRVHERIDEEASKARHNLNNQAQSAQGLVKEESNRAQGVEGVLTTAVQGLERGGFTFIQKVLWAALGAAAGSIAWLADKAFG